MTQNDSERPLRIAIVSSPRTGNTWLRHLFETALELPGLAEHNPGEVDWSNLPVGCVLQLHWHPTAEFRQLLAEHDFQIVALSRHPFDILISILHFTLHDATDRWLEGEGGDERSILGAMPRSAAFLAYAQGPRAAALLEVSREWWSLPDCHRMRYESLVADPQSELIRLLAALEAKPRLAVEQAIARCTIPKLRSQTHHQHHFWQGKPRLWQKLLTANEALPLAEHMQPLLDDLNYDSVPCPELSPLEADEHWIQLIGDRLAQDLRRIYPLDRSLAQAHAAIKELQAELQNERDQRALATALCEGLGPRSIALARRIQRVSHVFPMMSGLVKAMLRPIAKKAC
jgi:hypothetical protein